MTLSNRLAAAMAATVSEHGAAVRTSADVRVRVTAVHDWTAQRYDRVHTFRPELADAMTAQLRQRLTADGWTRIAITSERSILSEVC